MTNIALDYIVGNTTVSKCLVLIPLVFDKVLRDDKNRIVTLIIFFERIIKKKK